MHCWICDNKVSSFAAYGIPPRMGKCPHCGAKPRGRLLGWLLKEVLCPRLPDTARILEVGASRFSVARLLDPRIIGRNRCAIIDVRILGFHQRVPFPHGFVQMDVASMGFCERSFDLILCNNTLPYVLRDRDALGEIRRCLKPQGLAMINTHVESGVTVPVSEHRKTHPDLGDDYYAENGDRWVYGEDFFNRVSEAGLGYRMLRLFEGRSPDYFRENGLKPRSECLLAFTDPAALDRCVHPDVRVARAIGTASAGRQQSRA